MPLTPTLTEREFQAQVLELAALCGWRFMHQRPAMLRKGTWVTATTGHTGWPDLVLVRPPRMVIAELKTERGRPTLPQQAWLADLRLVLGIEVYLFRPSDWELIERVLGRDA